MNLTLPNYQIENYKKCLYKFDRDGGLKSSPISSNVAPKSRHSSFSKNSYAFQTCPKIKQIFGLILKENLLPRTLNNRPIWSHWLLPTLTGFPKLIIATFKEYIFGIFWKNWATFSHIVLSDFWESILTLFFLWISAWGPCTCRKCRRWPGQRGGQTCTRSCHRSCLKSW